MKNTNQENITEEIVLRTAEEYGFNLEYRTKCILDKEDYQVKTNEVVDLYGNGIEIDVSAKDSLGTKHILIECKGSMKGSALILLKAPPNISDIAHENSNKSSYLINHYRIPLYLFQENKFEYSFQGDFFNNNGRLTKIQKNDGKNNLYKAQDQICDAIEGYSFQRIEEKMPVTPFIIPLIVTNSEIWLVEYSDSISAQKMKWVLQCKALDNSSRLYKYFGSKKPTFYSIPVININHLAEFLIHFKSFKNENRINLASGKFVKNSNH